MTHSNDNFSAELMITEVFERMKRLLGKLARESEEANTGKPESTSAISDTAWRWISTVAALTSGRLLRFLRYPLYR
jgi:hypothetical protein